MADWEGMRATMARLREAIVRLVRDRQYRRAMSRFVRRLQRPPGQGSGDSISWTRDELHER